MTYLGNPIAFALGLLAWTLTAPAHGEDVLRVGAQSFPVSLGNPYSPIALPNALPIQAIFDPLTQVGPTGEVLPGLAVAWTQEAPNMWAFRLRPNVTFSNGEAFDAEAVVAALGYLQSDDGRRDSVASQDIRATIASFRARDPLTVEIVTVAPDPILPLHLSFLRIPAPHHWQSLGRAGFQGRPIGTGPYSVESWNESRLDLTAFRQSWRAPHADRIELLLIKDPAVRVQAFVSGSVDVAFALAPQDAAAVETVGGRLVPRANPLVQFLLFVTMHDTPLADVRVRRALNYAANKKLLLKTFLADAAPPASQFSHPMAFGFDPSLEPYPYDPDRARTLLSEAGYADGFSFTMLLEPSSGGSYADWFQQLAQDFAAVGVTMTVRATTLSRLIESVQTGNWPADAFAWTFAGFDAARGYRFRSCAWINPYHCDRDMMPLIETMDAAPTEAARLSATRTVLAYERDNPPGVLLWQGVAFDAVGGGVSDFAVEGDLMRWDRVGLRR